MILAGEIALWVAVLAAAWSALFSALSGITRRPGLGAAGQQLLYAACACVALSWAALGAALINGELSLRYVATYTALNLPVVYRLGAVWAGQAGAMLSWCLAVACVSAAAGVAVRGMPGALRVWMNTALGATLAFFLLMAALQAGPFERLAWIPREGRGLDPALQHIGMLLHPPVLNLGFAATVVPFALTLAALAARLRPDVWLGVVRRWTLVAWLLLTIGILLGMWWAYLAPERNGAWPLHGLANGSLLPWLSATALLHALAVARHRGMLHTWNVTLVVATCLLALLAASITRTGMVDGVYVFPVHRGGAWLLGFSACAIAATGWLLARGGDLLSAAAPAAPTLSREAALLSNNVVLGGIALAALAAVVPADGAMAGAAVRWAVGPHLFPAAIIPFGLLLLVLMAAGQLFEWGRAPARRAFAMPALAALGVGGVLVLAGMTDARAIAFLSLCALVVAAIVQDVWQASQARRARYDESALVGAVRAVTADRGRYGGYVVHCGVLSLVIGFTGTAFVQSHDLALGPGESRAVTDLWGRNWVFTSQGISSHEHLNRSIRLIALRPERDGVPQPLIRGEQRRYFDSFGREPFPGTSVPGVLSSLRQDVYVEFAGTARDGRANVRVAFHPFTQAVWWGGALMALGALFAMWAGRGASQAAALVRGAPTGSATAGGA